MSFLSISFGIFLLVLVLAYYAVPKKLQWRILLVGSIIFYLFAGYKTFIFIVVTITLTYITAIYFGKVNEEHSACLERNPTMTKQEKKAVKEKYNARKKGLLIIVVSICFGILIVLRAFKIIEGIGQLFAEIFHVSNIFNGVSVVVPLGISYYTFQAVAYLIDIYRRKYQPETNYAKYALFISFFPQLVQGPISRYNELNTQLYEEHSFDYENIKDALLLMLWGYFQKFVIGVRLEIVASTIMKDTTQYQGLYIIFATLLGWLKLYMDFSAGIDIARGAAQLFGIILPENFTQPFFAETVGEFWYRWHITLNNWWRDYIFYPLTTSKPLNSLRKKCRQIFGDDIGKKLPTFLVLIIVRIINSIWHGATFTALVGGIYHGLMVGFGFMLEEKIERLSKKLRINTECSSWKLFRMVRTYLIISVPEVMSNCRGPQDVLLRLKSLFSVWNPWILFDGSLSKLGITAKEWNVVILGLIIVLLVDIYKETGKSVREWISKQNIVFRWLFYYAFIFFILIYGAYGPGYDAASFRYAQY